MKTTNKGFTLVELAIVIVIIGLLVGGVLQGQELIKQAQIRSTLSAIQGYNAAVNTFRAKFNAMPGDVTQAADFGLNTPKGATGTINAAATNATTVSATAGGNGDGDGILETLTATPALSGATLFNAEISNFWTHLANSQLIKGSYPYSSAPVVGANYPSMPVGNGLLALTDGGLYWALGVKGTASTLGSDTASSSIVGGSYGASATSAAGMSPSEAFGIDSKLDDGIATTGLVQGVTNYTAAGAFTVITNGNTLCANTSTAYKTLSDAKDCTIRVRADG